MAAKLDLGTLIDPVQPELFFSRYWDQQPLLVTRDMRDYFDHVLTLEQIEDHLLSPIGVAFPTVAIIRPETTRGPEEAGPDGLNTDELHAQLRAGASVKWNRVEQHWGPLRALCRNLERIIDSKTGADLYVTPPSAAAYRPHYDGYDFFIVQISGSKHWTIYETRFPEAYGGSERVPGIDPGEPILEAVLRPGDVLYLPRGCFHSARATGELSVSVSIGMEPVTWYDALLDGLRALRDEDARLRASLPPGLLARPELANRLEREMHGLLRHICTEELARLAIERTLDRVTMQSLGPQSGMLSQIRDLAGVTGASWLRKRAGSRWRLARRGDKSVLTFTNKRVTFPAEAEPALAHILERDRVRAVDLPRIDEATALQLVRALVAEGLLVVDSPLRAAEMWGDTGVAKSTDPDLAAIGGAE